MAPEVMTQGRVSMASDVYAVSRARPAVLCTGPPLHPSAPAPADDSTSPSPSQTPHQTPSAPPAAQFGVLMWELFTGQHAFKGVPRALLGHEVAYQQLRPQFPEGCPFDYQLLACR
jgi:serine/threonine protein kinase